MQQVEFLSDCLSSSARQTQASAEIIARIAQYARSMPNVSMAWGPGNTVEHYRRFFSYLFHRLQRSREGAGTQNAYLNAAEFESDLILLRESLVSNRGSGLSAFISMFSIFASMPGFTPRS
jgi:phosphoenolpyruvate carboxylase